MTNPAGKSEDSHPLALPSAWTRLRAAAENKGTKSSSISPSSTFSLLGTYFAVWDSHTGMESEDDSGQEISWLELWLEPAGCRAVDGGDDESNAKEGHQSNAKKEEELEGASGSACSVPSHPAPQTSLADIRGQFRWWRKIGSFKGLKRDEGAIENLWVFDDVTWAELGEDEGGPEDDGQDQIRAANDFGLAELITRDDTGHPFVEMLYNTGETWVQNGEEEKMYCRIVWKKQKEAHSRFPLEISWKEGQRLMRDGTVDLETRYLEPEEVKDEKDADVDAEGDDDDRMRENAHAHAGVKREADDEQEGGGSAKCQKRVRKA